MKQSAVTGRQIHHDIKKLEDEIKELGDAFSELKVGSKSRIVIKNLLDDKTKLLNELLNANYEAVLSKEYGMY